MGHYIKRLSEGANYAQAAAGSGFAECSFRKLRRRDAEFAAMCAEAVERSCGMRFVHAGNKRKLQLQRNRRTKFTPQRQEAFLSHFAVTGNLTEAAAKADVSVSTVDKHRRKDPEFERLVLEALDHAHLRLRADLVAARIEAQRRQLKIGPDPESGPEFDRALKLLERWDRLRGGKAGAAGHSLEERWNFEETMILLEKKLNNRGIPIEPLPPGHERPDGGLPLLSPPPPPSGKADGGEAGDGEAGDGEAGDGEAGDEEEGGA
jgi:hypothetical protein